MHVKVDDAEKVLDNSTHTFIDLPVGAFDLIISPKETSVLYANMEGNAIKLYLYDVEKKTSNELTVIK